MNWYGSFQFHSRQGREACFLLREVDTNPLRLFRRIRTEGHVYKLHAEEPLATLQIASELVEQTHGPAPLHCHLPDELRRTIRQRIAQGQ